MTSSTASTLIFIDPTVEDYQSLIQGISPDVAVIVLNPNQDGIAQITQALVDRRSLNSVQIVAHGSAGNVWLGASQLGVETLDRYQNQLQQWSSALIQGADLLLWSCCVAAGEVGKTFVKRLSQITCSNVAASDRLVGSAAQGGNWTLGFTTGAIKTPAPFSQNTLAAYPATLASFNVTSATGLANAITQANASAEDDVIQINSDITLAGALPTISSNITFIGNKTISGASTHQIFKVDGSAAKVRFEDLTIANGRALGTTGIDGNKGGDGRGGGLFINQGNVTLVNVAFNNNQAKGGQGGANPGGTSGSGGNGLGGAVYIQSGSLRISTSSFNQNKADGGAASTVGSEFGTAGFGKGGAIYVNSGATVIAEGDPSFDRNAAANDIAQPGDDDNVFGSLTTVFPPVVASIACAQAQDTAEAQVSFTVSFNQDVTGVDESDFQVTTAPPDRPLRAGEQAITNAGIVSIEGSGKTYTVRVNTGTGNGFLGLNLVDNDSIKNSAEVPLGATGLGTGDMTGQSYTVDKTPPRVFAINRKTPATEKTAAAQVVYTATFTDNVTGVDTADFQVTQTGVTDASIADVKALNSNTYEVTVNTGNGNGELELRLVDNDTILNSRNVTLAGTGTNANGSFTGQKYTIDKTPPVVASITTPDPSPTNAGSVNYVVTFSQPITNVDVADFELVQLGVTGASILSVTNVTDAQTYVVAVNTGSGDGALALNLVDNDSITNLLGVRLGGNGTGNGNFAGPGYSLLKNAPVVDGITLVNPNPTASGTVNYAVTFSQDVTGVDASDFALPSVSVAGAGIASVTGSGRNYNVLVNTGIGSGALGLNLLDNDSIVNAVGTPLGGSGAGNGNFAGQAYNVNKTPPRITQINRLESNPTNAASVTFTAIFNENVVRVDADDFQLTTQGVTGASITSITRVNSSFYTVQVNTGNGDGTIGLNLIDNDSILNGLGVPLSGAGAGNGNFTGEVYTIDKAAPRARIVEVAPDPRRDKVNALTIEFTEAVSGFDLADLRLTRDGQAVDLSKATLTTDGGISWTLGNIKKLTNLRGDYSLSLAAGDSGIIDAAGNPFGTNLLERWTNLETVDACDPGIFRRGTPQKDTLQGTDDRDTLLGSNGDDLLIGLDCGDRLVGDRNNDTLDGGEGEDNLAGGTGNDALIGGRNRDFLKGGTGRDRFVFSGASEAEAFATSQADAPDRIADLKYAEKDKIQLNFDNNFKSKDRPKRLSHAGKVGGNTLQTAARNAYADKNQVADGRQSLRGEEAVFFKWRNRTYLAVNNGFAGFENSRDLLVNVSGISFKPGDANAGVLNVGNYFI